MKRITKFKSRNLYGENRDEEAARYDRVRGKMVRDAVMKGKLPDPLVMREVKFGGKLNFLGASKIQRKNRKKILSKVY